MRNAVIFDMDGTLADVRSIRHFVVPPTPKPKGWKKDFHAFHTLSVDVPANRHVVDHAIRASILGNAVVIVTARSAKYRPQTAWFLAMHNIPSDALYMRDDHDNRPDYDVKKDILTAIRREYNVIHAVDDNPEIIRLWNEEGIPCTIVEGFGF